MIVWHRVIWKALVFLFLVITYFATHGLLRLVVWNQVYKRWCCIRINLFYCRLCLAIMNFKVKAINLPEEKQTYLHVGNHLGILDIFFINSLRPCLFVTSIEMKNTPFLGQICEVGGCLYVERRSRANMAKEIEDMRTALAQGFNVVIYPEGTSTDGSTVLPFKKTIMTSAAAGSVPIKPVVQNYIEVNGEPMSHKWRDHVCWYGDETFAPAMLRMLSLESLTVQLEFLDEILVENEDQRNQVAAAAHGMIKERYRSIEYPPGTVPKWTPPTAKDVSLNRGSENTSIV